MIPAGTKGQCNARPGLDLLFIICLPECVGAYVWPWLAGQVCMQRTGNVHAINMEQLRMNCTYKNELQPYIDRRVLPIRVSRLKNLPHTHKPGVMSQGAASPLGASLLCCLSHVEEVLR
jgi:hypothetical protein